MSIDSPQLGRDLGSFLATSTDAIVAVDPTGTILFANSGAEGLFDYPPGELTGRPLELLLPEAGRRQHVRAREEFMSSPHARSMASGLEIWARRRDGSEVPVEVSLTPVETDGGLIVVAAARETAAQLPAFQRLLRLLDAAGAQLPELLEHARGASNGGLLTAREIEVLELAAQGLSAQQICERLVVSRSTVKTHFANIYRKLDVSDRAEAVARAIRVGLIK